MTRLAALLMAVALAACCFSAAQGRTMPAGHGAAPSAHHRPTQHSFASNRTAARAQPLLRAVEGEVMLLSLQTPRLLRLRASLAPSHRVFLLVAALAGLLFLAALSLRQLRALSEPPCQDDIETGSSKAQQPTPLFTFGNWQRYWEHRYLEIWKRGSFEQHRTLVKTTFKQMEALHRLWDKLGALDVVCPEQQQQGDIECGAPDASPSCSDDHNAWASLLPREPLDFGSDICQPCGLRLTDAGGRVVIAALDSQLCQAMIAARCLLEEVASGQKPAPGVAFPGP